VASEIEGEVQVAQPQVHSTPLKYASHRMTGVSMNRTLGLVL
jgi:hypothetical protein